jgi:hypothetical protein
MMTISKATERSLLRHGEFEFVSATHRPAISKLTSEELKRTRKRLRELRAKERTLKRHKRREVRGKSDRRGGSLPGTAEHPMKRKEVFAQALKRVDRELDRIQKREARAALMASTRRALDLRQEGNRSDRPATGKRARAGMRSLPSRRRRTKVHPGKIGRVSQATKVAQTRKDRRS